MKKWLLALVSVIILFTLCTYIFIPSRLIISTNIMMDATQNGTIRILYDPSKWSKWWPGDTTENNEGYDLNKYNYQVYKKYYDHLVVRISHHNSHYNSSIFVFAVPADSVLLKWKCNINSSLNPIKRIFQYHQAVVIAGGMKIIFDSLNSFLSNNSNIYNSFLIREITVKDSFLISTKKDFNHYPSTKEVYSLIQLLRTYMLKNNSAPIDSPMLNVTIIDSSHFRTEVAIPINKELKNEGNIIISKRLVTHGHMLETTVKGGIQKINLGTSQLDTYINDYKIILMAIPFQSLVTNRLQQPDSSQWVTKVYYPVF
jgi:hypothetical protein